MSACNCGCSAVPRCLNTLALSLSLCVCGAALQSGEEREREGEREGEKEGGGEGKGKGEGGSLPPLCSSMNATTLRGEEEPPGGPTVLLKEQRSGFYLTTYIRTS